MFTITNTQIMKSELIDKIEDVMAQIEASVRFDKIEDHIKNKLSETRKEAMRVYKTLEHKFDAERPHCEVISEIVARYASKEDRIPSYRYANLTRRIILLNAILGSSMKLTQVARKTVQGQIELECLTQKSVPLSALINKCPLKVQAYTKKNGTVVELSSLFAMDEIKLQFISELAELDLLDIKISQHTHMVEIPKAIASLVIETDWKLVSLYSQRLAKKTISTEPIPLDPKDLITKSSWYYNTPTLSKDQIEFVNVMHNTKYQFVDNALKLIEDAYMEHLKDDNGQLPQGWQSWVPQRIAFFKQQIKASFNNGGHYIPGKFDSALRWYMQSEIGHFQTSPSLRKLVKVATIDNSIKHDFKNNVVQMYSLLTKVRNLGKYVGLVQETDREEDLRLQIAKAMNSKLECDLFNKDNIKPLFMVWAYNAGKDRILDGVAVEEEGLFGLKVSKVKVPGLMTIANAKNTEANRELIWNAFNNTVTELAPAIVIIKQLFRNLIKNNPLTETSWTLPDGAIAQYASPATVDKTLYCVDSKGKQHQHTHYRKLITENEKSAGLLPRVIHSFDAYVARQLVIKAAAESITIIPNHDSFMFDVKHETRVLQIITDLFTELLESDYFASVIQELNKAGKSLAIKQANGTTITDSDLWNRYGKLTVEDLLKSNPTDLED